MVQLRQLCSLISDNELVMSTNWLHLRLSPHLEVVRCVARVKRALSANCMAWWCVPSTKPPLFLFYLRFPKELVFIKSYPKPKLETSHFLSILSARKTIIQNFIHLSATIEITSQRERKSQNKSELFIHPRPATFLPPTNLAPIPFRSTNPSLAL